MERNQQQNENESQIPYRVGYRTEIGFGQSVQTGIINIHGTIKYDYSDEAIDCINQMIDNLDYANKELRNRGYEVATDIKLRMSKDKDKKEKDNTKLNKGESTN